MYVFITVLKTAYHPRPPIILKSSFNITLHFGPICSKCSLSYKRPNRNVHSFCSTPLVPHCTNAAT